MEVGDRELERGRLPFLSDLLPQLRAHLLDDLFDARRVDAAVGDQFLQGDARHLAAQRLEGGDDDGLRRVVDDQVHARRRLQCADVAPLAADDAPLQIVGRQLDDRDRRFDDRVGGQALDRHADQAARLLRGLLGRFFLDAADQARRLDARVVLDGLDEVAPRVHGGQSGDLLQALPLLLDDPLRLALRLFDLLLGLGDGLLLAAVLLLAALLLGELAVEVLLLLEHSLFERGDFLAARLDGLVELGPGGENALLGLDRGLAQLGLRPAVGLRQDPVRLGADGPALALDGLAQRKVRDRGDRGGEQESRRDRDREICVHFGSPVPGRPKSGRRLHDDAEVSLPPRACDSLLRVSETDHSFHFVFPRPSRVADAALQASRASSSFRIRRSARATASVGLSLRCLSFW